jgi:hypothetical protein
MPSTLPESELLIAPPPHSYTMLPKAGLSVCGANCISILNMYITFNLSPILRHVACPAHIVSGCSSSTHLLILRSIGLTTHVLPAA